MGGGGGGVEKWRLKLTSAKVGVEVDAELGKKSPKNNLRFVFVSTVE